MLKPILATKLFSPPQDSKQLTRQPLVNRFADSDAGFWLICAPAGFGKTSLAADVVHDFAGQVAWLSLDAEDSDVGRFLHYVVATLQTVHKDIAPTSVTSLETEQLQANHVMVALINDLLSYQKPVLLVLDDYHLVANQAVHEALGFLLERRPANLTLLMTTRVDPPFALARMRAKGKLLEIRAEDLRFQEDDVSRFFERLGLELAPDQHHLLSKRTEGWVTGLKLAALSLHKQADKQAFIESFSGSHRFVLDYLLEEVLAQEDATTKQFLLATSILSRFCVPLCNALLKVDDAEASLAYLEKANLFLIPLDENRQWFRYHHLFATLLEHHLEASELNLPKLHTRASDWFAQAGLVDEAIHHAALAGAFDKATLLIHEHSGDLLLRGEVNRLERWLAVMPETLKTTHPSLANAQAWLLVLRSRGHEALTLLDKVEASLATSENDLQELADIGIFSEDELASAKGYLLTCRAVALGNVGSTFENAKNVDETNHLDTIQKTLERALEHFPVSDVDGRSVATFYLARYALVAKHYPEAERHFREAARLGRTGQQVYIGLSSRANLAILLRAAGKLREAQAICEDALTYANAHLNLAGQAAAALAYMHMVLGQLHDEWYDLDAAERHFRHALRISKQHGLDDLLQHIQIMLARVLLAQGRSEQAVQLVHSAHSLLARSHFPAVLTQKIHEALLEFWLLLAKTNPKYLEPYQQTYNRINSMNAPLEQPLIEAQYQYQRKNYATVLDIISKQRTHLDPEYQRDILLKLHVLEAATHLELNQSSDALSSLKTVLEHAEADGYVRTFVDLGGEALLRLLVHSATPTPYISQLIQALPTSEKPVSATNTDAWMLEPLSERELEILRLLPTGRSSPDLASYLDISVNTIKTHMKNIYSKLGVHKRHEAVTKAQELGIV